MSYSNGPDLLSDVVTGFGKLGGEDAYSLLVSAPLLAALREAGTSHIYADTADYIELQDLLSAGKGKLLAEVDGNTANQPLIKQIFHRYLDEANLTGWVEALRRHCENLTESQTLALVYAMVCGRVGNDFLRSFSSGRIWEVSLQLHMGLCRNVEEAKQIARYLRSMVRSALVKVAFTPHYPHCFLLARDLEREGIPVNFTSTFSARQAVAAALLSDVARTNIFLGRINQGLQAEILGEHVALQAQRSIIELRRRGESKTKLIAASIRDWQTFVRTAGCDAYTAPLETIHDLLHSGVSPKKISSKLGTSYEDKLRINKEVIRKLGAARIAALYNVEQEFVSFLLEYRQTAEYRDLRDGDRLFARFDTAGFGDLFYAPSNIEWKDIRRDKLPNLDAGLMHKVAIDTLYSLHADGDFEKTQQQMDQEITERLES